MPHIRITKAEFIEIKMEVRGNYKGYAYWQHSEAVTLKRHLLSATQKVDNT
jgi:hypothetical protein